MENNSLFRITDKGYSCEDVETYIQRLKAEYKKVFEYAKLTEENNEKLKKICQTLSDENKALKETGSTATGDSKAVNVDELIELIDTLKSKLIELK